MKSIFLYIFFLCVVVMDILAGQFRPWFSSSVIWGQGGLGISYEMSNTTIRVYDSFVWDWGDSEISYNQIDGEIEVYDYSFGLRHRMEKEQDGYNEEYSPFAGITTYLYKDKLFKVYTYNELEYRNNPFEFQEDYVRYNNYTCLIYRKGVFEDNLLKPYIANSIYFDLDNMEFEKDRIYLGYMVELKNAFFGAYVIPYRWGETSGSWDDSKNFGAFLTFNF